MLAKFAILAFVCYFSTVEAQKIAGLEGKWRVARAEKFNGRIWYVISTPLWRGYTLEVKAITEDEASKPIARGYRRSKKTKVFIPRKSFRVPKAASFRKAFTRSNIAVQYADKPETNTVNNEVAPTQPDQTVQQPTTEPAVVVPPTAPAQEPRVAYYSFTFFVKNKINAILKLREDGKWTIIEGEHTLSIPHGEDYRAEIYIEKILEAFRYMTIKDQNTMFMYGRGNRMLKLKKSE